MIQSQIIKTSSMVKPINVHDDPLVLTAIDNLEKASFFDHDKTIGSYTAEGSGSDSAERLAHYLPSGFDDNTND